MRRPVGCPTAGGDTLVSAEISTRMPDAGVFDVLLRLVGADGRAVPLRRSGRAREPDRRRRIQYRATALEDIITAKEQADRSKDREAIPELHAIRDARTASSGGTSSSTRSPPVIPPPRRKRSGMRLFRRRGREQRWRRPGATEMASTGSHRHIAERRAARDTNPRAGQIGQLLELPPL